MRGWAAARFLLVLSGCSASLMIAQIWYDNSVLRHDFSSQFEVVRPPKATFRTEGVQALNGHGENDMFFSCSCDGTFAEPDGLVPVLVKKTNQSEIASMKFQIRNLSKELGMHLVFDKNEFSLLKPNVREYKGTLPFTNDGFDPTCGKRSTFTSDKSWFRDHYRSESCQSLPRERALAFVLANLLPQWENAILFHESSPGTTSSNAIQNRLGEAYVATQYHPKTRCGSLIPGKKIRKWYSLDLEKQCLADESVDILLTQDVLEHIYDPNAVFREIERTLRPGGFHIFTVPLVNKHLASFRSASRERRVTGGHFYKETGRVLLHSQPSIHGNPVNGQGALQTWYWGFDIVSLIRKVSGLETMTVFVNSSALGIKRSEYIEVLISRKVGTNPSFPGIWQRLSSLNFCPQIVCTADFKNSKEHVGL